MAEFRIDSSEEDRRIMMVVQRGDDFARELRLYGEFVRERNAQALQKQNENQT